jgi:hypothetical protein
MLETLTNSKDWFKDKTNVQVIDIGLLPRQLEKKPCFIETPTVSAGKLSPELEKTLSESERAWLMKPQLVRLESIPPQSLIRLITRAIALSKDPSSANCLVPVGDTTDGGFWVYSVDSFG